MWNSALLLRQKDKCRCSNTEKNCSITTTLNGLLQKLQSHPTSHSELFLHNRFNVVNSISSRLKRIYCWFESIMCLHLQASRDIISSSQTYKYTVLTKTKATAPPERCQKYLHIIGLVCCFLQDGNFSIRASKKGFTLPSVLLHVRQA